MTTKRERAKQKYRQQYGTPPPNDAALTTFMATLSTSDFSGCSDASVWDAGSCDTSSGDSGAACGGGGCGGG